MRRRAPLAPRPVVSVYIWEWPVRVTHWITVAAIVSLSVTGLYIGAPLQAVGSLLPMTTVKAIHSYSAIAFTLSVLSRVMWMFLGNDYARWDKFLLFRRKRLRGFATTLRFYLLGLRKPPGYLGHNPLAGLVYTLVILLFFLQIATGFAMYSASAALGSPMRWFTFLGPLFGGLQTARWLHHGIMWAIIGFAVHHVYSAVLMSQVEANATVESIFSGYKFVPADYLVERKGILEGREDAQ
jgi:Ni/Fe-hydrogenase 1 B-type cytochrome subunit